MAYIIAPIEILRHAYDNPQGFRERCEVFHYRRRNQPLPENLKFVSAYIDALPKSGCNVQISYAQIKFLDNLLDEDVYPKTRQSRMLILLGWFALRSIQGMSADYKKANNKLFIARMAGYNNWKDYEQSNDLGMLGVLKVQPDRTTAKFCQDLRRKIEEAFDFVKFRDAENRRGWEFTTKPERIKI